MTNINTISKSNTSHQASANSNTQQEVSAQDAENFAQRVNEQKNNEPKNSEQKNNEQKNFEPKTEEQKSKQRQVIGDAILNAKEQKDNEQQVRQRQAINDAILNAKKLSSSEPNTQEQQVKQKKSVGDAILGGLSQQSAPNQAIPEKMAVQSVQSVKMPDEMINKLVDNILVSSKADNQEVHLKVNNNILPDTNIIMRMDAGKLSVQLATANEQSALTLHQNVGELENRLQHLSKDKEVSVKVVETNSKDSSNSEQNPEQRSRGEFLWDE